ncbi:MAG: lactonase family protein [Armatimonadota bacterium]
MLVYIGTYSKRGSKGIYVYRMDAKSGALTRVGDIGGGVENPSFLALHPNGRFLYSACESGGGTVAAFALNPTTGIPTLLNQQSAHGGGTCHVSVDHAGKNVLAANYNTGSIAALPIGPDGKLLPATAAIQHKGGSKADPKRQEGPHAHSINPDAKDRFAVAVDLGLDKMLVYRFDKAKGTLTPNDPPSTSTKPGAGPRHFAFHPNGKLGFVINELNSTVSSYRYDDSRGTLTEIQTLSTLPEGFTGANYPAEVAVHPSGKFLYGSNRGHDSIAVFKIDGASGKLQAIAHTPTQGKNPRNFGITPAGDFLIAAHQDTDNLVVFRINRQTGRLTPTGQVVEVPVPVCVRFASEK